MRPKGIRVVPYLNTLTWRRADAQGHGLDSHVDWVDRDMLGRAHGEPVRGLGKPGRDMFQAGLLDPMVLAGPTDLVRPREPAVRSRLTAFLDDLALRDGVSSVAFAQWAPMLPAFYSMPVIAAPGPYHEPHGLPWDSLSSLGFAVPERLALLAAGKDDPVDSAPVNQMGSFQPRIYAPDGTAQFGPFAQAVENPYPALVRALLQRAKAKNWKTYVFLDAPLFADSFLRVEPRDKRADPLPADVYVTSLLQEAPSGAMLIPVWHKNAPEAGMWKDVNPAAVPFLLLGSMSHGDASTLEQGLPLVLDFRAAPERLSEIIGTVRPGAKPTAKKPPARKPAARKPAPKSYHGKR
jgi:hypothetical protein